MTWPLRPDAPIDPQMRAFFDAIADDPAVRLVFADWLEERGDPRAQLLRLQAEYARLGETLQDQSAVVEQVRAWEAAHRRDWLGELPVVNGFALRVQKGLFEVMDLEGLGQSLLESQVYQPLRQAIREGWFPILRLLMWNSDLLAQAASRGFFAGPLAIELHGGRGANPRLESLRDLPRLRQVLIAGGDSSVNDEGMIHLGTLASLQALSLTYLGLTGSGLVHLLPLKDLRLLSLLGCTRLNNETLVHLGEFPRLERLSLARCIGLSQASLSHIGRLKGLRHLDLSNWSSLAFEGLALLRPLLNLQSLLLSRCGELTDESLDLLAGHSQLEILDLTDCLRLTATGVTRLALFLPRLRRLDLTGCRLRPHETRAIRKALPNCEVIR